MTENKSKEIIDRLSQQVGQTWTKVQPQIQMLLLKVVNGLLPALLNLQTKLTDTTPAAPSSNPNLDKVLNTTKAIASKVIAATISTFSKLQQNLGGQTVTLDANGEPVALLNASTETVSPLIAQAEQEFGIAWKFVKEKLNPKILEFLQITVNKLDPIATNIWQTVSTKAATTPALVKSWEKVQANDIWKKTATATAPIWRSISAIAQQVPLSDEVQRIFDKRAGTIALVTLFSLLILLKPSPAHSRNVQNIASNPAPIANVNKKQAPITTDLVKPDLPLTAEQIAIAKVENQVSEVANQYGESLLGSVQTSFKRGRLIVALNSGWYELEPSQQKQLVDDLQNRSRSLNLPKLFVADAENHIVARTPVTGDGVIILRN